MNRRKASLSFEDNSMSFNEEITFTIIKLIFVTKFRIPF